MKEYYKIFLEFITKDNGDYNIWGKLILSLFIIFVTFVVNKVIYRLLSKLLEKSQEHRSLEAKKRIETYNSLLANVVRVIIYFIGIINVLDLLGVNTASIIATAGIGSVAIGFGSQSLVKDTITGLFILLEDQYAIGDYVNIEDFEGVVEEFSLRLTKIRAIDGELHMIPNGNITAVTNRSRGEKTTLLRYNVSYHVDEDKVIKILEEAMKAVIKNEDIKALIKNGPTVQGISGILDTGIQIQISVSTNYKDQWTVSRAINKEVKIALTANDIEIPRVKMEIVSPQEEV